MFSCLDPSLGSLYHLRRLHRPGCRYGQHRCARSSFMWFPFAFISLAVDSSRCVPPSLASDSWRSYCVLHTLRPCGPLRYTYWTITSCLRLEIHAARITDSRALGTVGSWFHGRSILGYSIHGGRRKTPSMGQSRQKLFANRFDGARSWGRIFPLSRRVTLVSFGSSSRPIPLSLWLSAMIANIYRSSLLIGIDRLSPSFLS